MLAVIIRERLRSGELRSMSVVSVLLAQAKTVGRLRNQRQLVSCETNDRQSVVEPKTVVIVADPETVINKAIESQIYLQKE